MLPLPTGRDANLGKGAPLYVRHRPERTLLYQLIEEYYPRFEAQCAFEGRVLGIVYRVIATHLIAKDGMYAGFAGAKTGD